ncbi:hypothetical protein Tco_0903650 [Tanacetum coccineum]
MVLPLKLSILKKGKYTLWSMRMEQYLTNTDYSLWQVILNGDCPIQVTTDEKGVETELRFHAIKDAKTLWAAIKSRFGEVHGAVVSNEDANQKFLRALPSSWNNVALIMRNKDGIDDLDIDDLYNNLKVFEADIKGHNSQGQASSTSYTDDLMFSFFANQSNSPQLDNEDLEQIDYDDLEEMDLKWLNALTLIEGAILQGNLEHQEIKGTRMEMQGIGAGTTPEGLYIAQDEPTEFALRAHTANSTGSDIERQTLSKANLEIVAYQLGLESVEAQLVVHQKNEVVYEEKIAVLEFEVKDKSNAVTRLKNQLDETLREKDDLKAKLEQFETSSKNLNKLINSQLSAKDKTGLGYGDQLNENDSKGSELFNSVFDSRSRDEDDNQTNDRPSGVIIEDWVSDDDEDIFQSNDLQATDKPSFKRIKFTNARNESVRPKQAEKPRIITQNPKVDRRDWNGNDSKTRVRIWVYKESLFFLTRSGRVPVSTVKQSSFRAVASTGAVKQVNTATHTNRVNVSKLRTNAFHKSNSPIRRSFYKSTAPNTKISNEKVYTIRVNGVNTAGQTAGNSQQALKNKGIFDSGCSRHMTGNKDFLTDYQELDGGFVAFGGSNRDGEDTH